MWLQSDWATVPVTGTTEELPSKNSCAMFYRCTATMLLLLLVGATLLASSASLSADEQLLTIRATSALPDEVIDYVARSSAPAPMEIRVKEAVKDFISSVCGAYTDSFAKVFFEINPAIALDVRPKPFIRPVNMPACVKWRNDTPVTVNNGDDLDKLLMRKIGRHSSDRLACDAKQAGPRCNATFRELVALENPGKDLDHLSDGELLVLPLITVPTTIRIRHGLNAEDVRSKIADLSKQYADVDPSVIKNTITRPALLLANKDLPLHDISCIDAAQTAQQDGRAWPYDSKQIAEVINRTLKIARQRYDGPSATVVTLIDTGLYDNVPNVPIKQNNLKNGMAANGFGVARSDNTIPFSDYDMGWHGTRVAEILADASGLTTKQLAELVKINIADVVIKKETGEYAIDPNGIILGITYALDTAKVANVSIGSETAMKTILDMIAGKSLLAVVAAGNERRELSQTNYPLYPALYGGKHEPGGQQVITVAGYDGGLGLAEFSNWSGIFADIAAPACGISYGSHGGTLVSGTSFAAPLVSLTAAVIDAFASDAKPHDLKNRIQASVDFDPSLAGHIVWEGRLNIAKAVSLYEDVIEVHSPSKLTFGEWIADDPDYVQFCADGHGYDPETVTKVVSLASSPPYSIQVQHREEGLLIMDAPCEPMGEGMTFFNSDSKAQSVVPWSNIADYVRRYFTEYSPLKESGKADVAPIP
jgi:subtilisin family serine protease